MPEGPKFAILRSDLSKFLITEFEPLLRMEFDSETDSTEFLSLKSDSIKEIILFLYRVEVGKFPKMEFESEELEWILEELTSLHC